MNNDSITIYLQRLPAPLRRHEKSDNMRSPYFLAKTFNIRLKKQLGQNFLSDPSTAAMIVDRCRLDPADTVLEIGPGFGALTVTAAPRVRRLVAVETDGRVIPVLESELAAGRIENVTILHQSILSTDLTDLARQANCRFVVLGNLPYNISSQILIQLMLSRSVVKRAILMFQKELAQRIMAPPSCKEYGRLSVMLQYLADIRPVASVKAHLFTPRPKVDSEVIEVDFKPHIPHPAADEDLLFRVIKAGFGKRRKNLKNALCGSELNLDTETVLDILDQSGIESNRRAESLAVEEFVTLSNCLHARIRSTK